MRMKPNKDDAYKDDENNKPSMNIETSETDLTLISDENRNDIAKQFRIYVINCSLKQYHLEF